MILSYENTDVKPTAPVASAIQNAGTEVRDQLEPAAAPAPAGDEDNTGYDAMNPDAYDDENDVDFNLGGGNASSSTRVMPQDDMPTAPPYGTVHKASAREDG
jgi:RNA-binding protein Musashi